MRHMKKSMTNAVSDRFSVPPEAISQAPLIQIRGGRSVCIENHRGIRLYTGEEIQIAVRQGTVTVKGQSLNIARMTRRLVEIRGVLRAVEMD